MRQRRQVRRSATACGAALATTASLLLAGAATAPSASALTAAPVYVNSGGGIFVDSTGRRWVPDTGASGGWVSSTGAGISGTSHDYLYQSVRTGLSTYALPAVNGTYTLTLHFAETSYSASGKRVFSVSAEGSSVVTDLDVYRAVGKNAAHTVSKTVSITDGRLDLRFTARTDRPSIAGVELLPVPTSTTAPVPTTPPPTTSPTPTPTTPTPTPTSPTPTAPPPAPAVGARDLTLQPFSSTSIWNLPIGTGATFESATAARTANLVGTGGAWVNEARYSHPVARATSSDPLAVVTDTKDATRSGTYRIPTTAPIAAGNDMHMHVISPDGRYVDEAWSTRRLSSTSYTVGRHHKVDLQGTGIGPRNGTRAYGGSAIGGLVRAWEVDPTHPKYTGVIKHPIAIALRNDQLLYTGGSYGYRTDGTMVQSGYTWPATEQDWDSPAAYTGKIPMGSYVALPPSVDVKALGLSPQGLMLARAYQDYGAYVTDRSGDMIMAFVEPSAAGNRFAQALLGPSSTAADLKKLRPLLRVVTNNSAATPNAAPLGGARRAPLLP